MDDRLSFDTSFSFGTSGHVYFVYDGVQFLKIGWCKRNLRNRLQHLQIGNPWRLCVLGTIKAHVQFEKLLHIRYNHWRVRSEWFMPDGEMWADLFEKYGISKDVEIDIDEWEPSIYGR